jgi:hypothetical protein
MAALWPLVVAAFAVVLFLLGLSVTPARVVPWPWAARVVDERAEQFVLISLVIASAAAVLLFVVMTTA